MLTLSLSLQYSVNKLYEQSEVCPALIDMERTLALLQGLRAYSMVESIPVEVVEEECDKWLSQEMFSGGLELHPLITMETTNKPKATVNTLQRQSSLDLGHALLCGLSQPLIGDEKLVSFMSLIHQYSKEHNQLMLATDQNPEHPVEYLGRLYMTCLIKLRDLVHLVLSMIEQLSSPNNDHGNQGNPVQMPAPLAEICKAVYEAKVALVKAHQESLCTYEEVCREPIQRCLLIIAHIRSPIVNVVGLLHKNQLQHVKTRWRQCARQALKVFKGEHGKGMQGPQASDPLPPKEKASMKYSRDIKQLKEVSPNQVCCIWSRVFWAGEELCCYAACQRFKGYDSSYPHTPSVLHLGLCES